MSEGGENDELVSQFMAFTGSADPARAASYLEMSGGNLETAVGLYMEHETPGGGGAAAGTGGLGAGSPADEIRAPDATQSMRLMDDHMAPVNPDYQLMRDMMEEQLSSAFAAPASIDARAAVNAAAAAEYYEDEEKEDMEDVEDDEVQIVPGGSMAPARLSDMFAAPTHLMHRAGGFQGARTVAKDSKRWLLVNIQKDSEFATHALNRDVWRDELVENLIREGFIFWQQVRDAIPLSLCFSSSRRIRTQNLTLPLPCYHIDGHSAGRTNLHNSLPSTRLSTRWFH
jgi:hypothetical protein